MTIEQQLKNLAMKSGMTRRGFMQRALALGATTALATTLADKAFCSRAQEGRPLPVRAWARGDLGLA